MQDKESELLGLIEAWSQRFDIPIATMRERLKDVPAIEIRLHDHAPSAPAYLESDVRRVCADLLSQNEL